VLDGWPPAEFGGGSGGDGGGGDGGGGRPEGGEPEADAARLALVLALICIGVLFTVCIAIALLVAKTSAQWPPAGAPEPPNGLLVSTLLLLGCSGALARSLGSMRRAKRGIALRAAWLAGGLGVAFLGVQALLWRDIVQAGLPASNGYVALFYILTGLHALHVAGGLVFLGRAVHALHTSPSVLLLHLTAVYWHAMGVIWIALFTILYLVR